MPSESVPSLIESEHDEWAAFGPVLAVLRLSEAPALAASLWESKNSGRPLAGMPIVGTPLHGSYHILFPVDFPSGERWLLKIPITGTPEHWDEASASALMSEALTMRFIRQRTTIPVPEVFGFCSNLRNELCCPHIWLSFIHGISLQDMWFDKTAENHHRRTRVLEDVATAMVQLRQFLFPMGGRILFNDSGKPVGVGAIREVDHYATFKRQMSEDSDHMPIYVERGPFHNTREFFTRAITGDHDISLFLVGQERLLRLFIDCAASFFSANDGSFVLTHPDFDIQNFIVSTEGELLGIIDWDGVCAWPKCLGSKRYPGWLTRDWDPGMYGYGSDGLPHHSDMREDSPQTLAHYRQVYRDIMERVLGTQNGGPQEAGGQGSDKYETSSTLILENLEIAASVRMGRGNIVGKIIKEIAAIINIPGDLDFDFLYMDLCNKAGADQLTMETKEALRIGLELLLQNQSL